MSNWFKALFAAVMLAFAAVAALSCVQQVKLQAQLEDLQISLDTNQARERKQTYEYDQVVAEIPQKQAELAELQPKADAAAAQVTELKATRKALRASNKELQAQVDALATGTDLAAAENAPAGGQ